MPRPPNDEPTPPDPDDPFPDEPADPRPNAGRLDPAARQRIDDEILFQRTRRELAAGPPPAAAPRGGRLLLLSAGAAAALVFGEEGLRWVAAAVPVVLLHELGHVAGMWLFRFRNPRLFVLPAFAALARGRPDAAPWQTAVVLLLGPLPGVAAGLTAYAVTGPPAESWVSALCLVAVVFNALNLLPVVPLDGGRLFDVLFLARRPWPGTVYRLLAAAGLIAGAVATEAPVGRIGLAAAAGVVLLATPIAHRRAVVRRAVGVRFPGLPAKADALSDRQLNTLLRAVQQTLPTEDDPRRLAAAVRLLHAQATAQPAGLAVSGLLMAAYLAGVGAAAGFLTLYAGTAATV